MFNQSNIPQEKQILSSKLFGIDLGTTTTQCCCWDSITNKMTQLEFKSEGGKYLRSAIKFTEDEIIIGKEALNSKKKGVLITESKRLIGRKYKEISEEEKKQFTYEIIPNKDGFCDIVLDKERNRKTSPTQVAQLLYEEVVKNIKMIYEIDDIYATLTIPANFNDNQRDQTHLAALAAGIKVIALINEPSAAGYRYRELAENVINNKILIFDLGGGTFDVTISHFDEKEMKILCTNGNNMLGGKDITNNLKQLVLTKYKNEFGEEYKIVNDDEFYQICEKAKIDLSIDDKTTIYLSSSEEDEIEITREEFEKANLKMMQEIRECVNECLKLGELTRDDIHDVLLVGGSTLVPFIKTVAKEYNQRNEMFMKVIPQTIVSEGAASYSKMRIGYKIVDISSFYYGTSANQGEFHVMVKKGDVIPKRVVHYFRPTTIGQTDILFDLYRTSTLKKQDGNDITINDLKGKEENELVAFQMKLPPYRNKEEVLFQVILDIHDDGTIDLTSQQILPARKDGKEHPRESKLNIAKETMHHRIEQVQKETRAIVEMIEKDKILKKEFSDLKKKLKDMKKKFSKEKQSEYSDVFKQTEKMKKEDIDKIRENVQFLENKLNDENGKTEEKQHVEKKTGESIDIENNDDDEIEMTKPKIKTDSNKTEDQSEEIKEKKPIDQKTFIAFKKECTNYINKEIPQELKNRNEEIKNTISKINSMNKKEQYYELENFLALLKQQVEEKSNK